MSSQSPTASSLSSASSADTGVEQVLRKTYKDPGKLREGLDRLWGQGNYRLRLRNNRYIIRGPWPLNQDELQQLEKDAYQHYDDY
ncbi:hypothetical protein AK830_g10666 [Neonectria ditissima]|uniref:Uncharacterized protein n=1 Tax=Neonectria ditissima TaxID=78410 RepID=A0A0P7B5Y4_9HYPO|nr:hypothetical protein AK830_g10666 [Neonectria ditissima]